VAEEMELPALVGTEKQIAWAETLRIQKLNEIETKVEDFEKRESEAYRRVLMVVEKISNETSAKRWIEWRDDSPEYILSSVLRAMKSVPTDEQKRAEQEAREQAEAIQRAALVEATIRPASAIAETPAEIKVHTNAIFVTFPERRNAFSELVKSMGYSWSGGNQWRRVIGKFAGDPVERAIELGHTLLSRGFLVRCFDDDLRARIVAGAFKPEQTRWISKLVEGDYIGWFAIQWGRNEDYYEVARKLKNSKYSKPHVVVPPVQFEQVLDFAQMYDFRLSPGAQEVVRLAREDKEKMLVVSKEPVGKREKIVASVVPPLLAVPDSVAIADDLKDEG
jgi:hypothetical protein